MLNIVSELLNGNNCPIGSDYDSRAPWNEDKKEPVSIEAYLELTISKKVFVNVTDYEQMEDGYINTSNCDLRIAIDEKKEFPELKGWTIENVIVEEI